MPRLDVCDPRDCRVAFISRGQPQEVASVASDASAARCGGIVDTGKPTGIRWRESTRSMVGLYALYRLDLKGSGDKAAWIEKPSRCLLLFFGLQAA